MKYPIRAKLVFKHQVEGLGVFKALKKALKGQTMAGPSYIEFYVDGEPNGTIERWDNDNLR